MRALVLTHPEADYGADFLWNGLNIVLGQGNVVDYPAKPRYHGQVAVNVDIPEQGIYGGTVGLSPWLTPSPVSRMTNAVTENLLNQGYFDFVIVESPRLYALKQFECIKHLIPDTTKVILHDGEDDTRFHGLNGWHREYIYLKRELLKSRPIHFKEGNVTILSFPFSAPDSLAGSAIKPYGECQYSIAALFGGSWEGRKVLCDALHPVPNAYVAHGNTMNHETGQHSLQSFDEYVETLRDSRFGVSMRGYGYDTCRYWEVAVTTGLLADVLDIHIPNPFQPGINAYLYRNIAEAKDIAQFIATKSGDYTAEVRMKGILHAREHHTNSARVRWMLEQILN